MQLIKSLKELIRLKASAFYITEGTPELIKEIQAILDIPTTGVADDRSIEALSKFKSDRQLPHPLGVGVDTAIALMSHSNSYLMLTKTNRKDSYGAVVLKLQYFKKGRIFDELTCCSGQPSKQNFRIGRESKSGSGEPLPEGRWIIGDIKWADGRNNYDGGIFADGVGPVSVPLEYDGPDWTSRSAIEIHPDWNRPEGKPGTVGCVGFYVLDDMKRFINWLREGDPRYFYVNWNLGTCPNVATPK